MKFAVDFHIHSKYSRATSPQTNLEILDKWAKIKGVKVLGTGDFTHPEWLSEIKEKLEPAEPGLFKLKKSDNSTRFILTSEISCIYSKNGKVRKIHILVFAPSLDIVEKINAQLGWIGNLKSDGRPILGLDAKELTKIVLNASQDCLVVPAHLLTPWFSLFGSKSGFDSLEECFEDYSQYIYAGETGLSADPSMLWRMPDGRRITLISNSDCHSPQKIGREANVFDTEISYQAIIEAIKAKDPERFLYTIEFFPEEGKYHVDGHADCGFYCEPEKTKKLGGRCPKCGKLLTVGVLSRIEELSNREMNPSKPERAVPFEYIIPLKELISEHLGKGKKSKAVCVMYGEMIKNASEFKILLDLNAIELEKIMPKVLVDGILDMRSGKVVVTPGYDGVFGKISVKGIGQSRSKQENLF